MTNNDTFATLLALAFLAHCALVYGLVRLSYEPRQAEPVPPTWTTTTTSESNP